MMSFLINLLKKTQRSVPYTVKYFEWCVKEEKLLADN